MFNKTKSKFKSLEAEIKSLKNRIFKDKSDNESDYISWFRFVPIFNNKYSLEERLEDVENKLIAICKSLELEFFYKDKEEAHWTVNKKQKKTKRTYKKSMFSK